MKKIVNNLYKSNSEWDDCLISKEERLNESKKIVVEALEFIDNAIDQILAYSG